MMTGGKDQAGKSILRFWRIPALLATVPIILFSPFFGIMTAILHENNVPQMWEVLAWGLLPGASTAIFFALAGRFLPNVARWASVVLIALALSLVAFVPHLAILAFIAWPLLGIALLVTLSTTFVQIAKNAASELDVQIRWIASAMILPIGIISALLAIRSVWGGPWFIGVERFDEVFASSLLFGALTATTGTLMFRRVTPLNQAPN